jgi:hypothetical protein
MAEAARLAGVVGLFDEPDALLRAAELVRDAGYLQWDCHSPYPIHGLDRAMGLRPSGLGKLTITAGLVGAGSALLMQWWMSAVDYPVRIGGKALASWPAFVPVTFELFVLFAALATMGGLLVLCRLGRWHSPLHDSGVMAEVTASRMAVVLSASDPSFSHAQARRLLEQAGSNDVRDLWDTGGEGRIL